jgi:hypothetical protein
LGEDGVVFSDEGNKVAASVHFHDEVKGIFGLKDFVKVQEIVLGEGFEDVDLILDCGLVGWCRKGAGFGEGFDCEAAAIEGAFDFVDSGESSFADFSDGSELFVEAELG